MLAEDERRPSDEVPFDLPDATPNPRDLAAAEAAAGEARLDAPARAEPWPRPERLPPPRWGHSLGGVAMAVARGAERLATQARHLEAALTRLAAEQALRGAHARARPLVYAGASIGLAAHCLLTLRRPSGRPADVECAAEVLRLMQLAFAGAGPLGSGPETLRAWRDALDLAAAEAESVAGLPLAAAGFSSTPRLLRATARALDAAAEAAARAGG